MEDYSTVIWVVAIFAAMLFNATSQARKKAKNRFTRPKKHTQHEAWPSWDTQSADEMRHPDSQETVSERKPTDCVPQCSRRHRRPDSVKSPAKRPISKAPGGMPDAKRSGRTVSTKKSCTKNTQQGTRHTTAEAVTEITEDFDLRKAVIYSEILKPKFNEE